MSSCEIRSDSSVHTFSRSVTWDCLVDDVIATNVIEDTSSSCGEGNCQEQNTVYSCLLTD